MASDNLKTAIEIGVNVQGADKLSQLSDGLGDIAREAGTAAPAFGEMAGGMREAGAQTDTLAGKQGELAGRTREAGAAAEKSAQQQVFSHRKVADGVQSISTQLDKLQTAYARLAGALAVIGGVRGLQQMADEVQNLRSRVKLAVGDAADMEGVWKKVGDVAKATNSSLSATGDLFARVTKAARDAGKSGQQAIDEALQITTAVNQAAQLSGASAQASEAAVKQLVQALQSGVLRGDEFNSVMEQAPRLAQALADGLGVTTGALREMAQNGKLTAEVVTEAIKSQAGALEQEFGSLPQTVGRAMQNLATQLQLYVGEVNESWGVTSKAAGAVDLLADNINKVAHAAKTLTAFKIAGWLKEWAAAKIATVENTAATTENTAAQGANAQARTAASAAASGQAAALGAATKATTANTAATTAGAAVSGAWGKAAQFATGMAGKLATGLKLLARSAAPLAAIELVVNAREYGKAIGEAAARLAGFRDKSDAWAQAQELQNRQAQERTQRMKEFADAVQSGAIVFDAASGKFLKAEEALSKAGLSAVNAVKQFVELQEAGKKTADALDGLRKSMDVGDEASVAGMVRAFEALQTAGRASAEEIAAAWQRAVQSMDAKQVDMFATSLQLAEKQGQITAQQLEGAFKNLVGGALQDLGANAAQALGGISKQAQVAIDGVGRVAQALQSTGADADTVKRSMEAAFAAAIPKADSLAAIKELEKRLLAAKDAGQVSEYAFRSMTAALDGMKEALDPVNKLEKALDALGVKMTKTWGGMSSGAKDAIKNVKEVRGIIAETGETGKKAGETIKAAFLGAIKKMDSLDAIKAMREEIKAAGEAGQLTAGQMGELGAALNQQEAALRQNTTAAGEQAGAMGEAGDKADEYANALVYLGSAGGDVSSAAIEAADALSQLGSSAQGGWSKVAEGARDAADAARDAADAAKEADEAHKSAGRSSTVYWMGAKAEVSRYREEASQWALDTVDKVGTGVNGYLRSFRSYFSAVANYFRQLKEATDLYAETMERLDAQQRRLASQQSGAAAGVEDLKLRLLELGGTEEEIEQARAARERAQLEREIKMLEIEKSRAAFQGDSATASQLSEEITLMQEQLRLLDQVHGAEKKQREQAAKERAREAKEREKSEREAREREEREREAKEREEAAKEREQAAKEREQAAKEREREQERAAKEREQAAKEREQAAKEREREAREREARDKAQPSSGGAGGASTVTINLNGKRTSLTVGSAAEAHSLETLLREIADDQRRAA